jgi:hypothetical protein
VGVPPFPGIPRLYQRPSGLTHGDSHSGRDLIRWRGEDLRDASSRENADGFVGQ